MENVNNTINGIDNNKSTTLTEILTTTPSTAIPNPTTTAHTTPTEVHEYDIHPNIEKAQNISSLKIPFITYFGGGVLLFLGFCFLRNRIKIFYMPRRRLKNCSPPRISSGFFSWILAILNIKTSYALPLVGMDAYVFLLFLKMCMKTFISIGVIGILFILPINYSGNSQLKSADSYNSDLSFIQLLTINNIPLQSNLLILHLIATILISLVSYYFLITFYNECRSLRMKYVEGCYNNNYKQLINFRSIMIFGLPKEMRDETVLFNFFNELGIGDLEKVTVCKQYTHLRKALKKREYYLKKIESFYTSWIKYEKNNKDNDNNNNQNIPEKSLKSKINKKKDFHKMKEHMDSAGSNLFFEVRNSSKVGLTNEFTSDNEAIVPHYSEILLENKNPKKKKPLGRLYLFGQKIDILNYYIEKFIKWDKYVVKLRQQNIKSNYTPVAFIIFKSPLSAMIGAQCLIHRAPFTCFVDVAPEPRDIYWKNISNRLAHPYAKLLRAICVSILSVILVFIWFIPLSFIISMTNLYKLSLISPLFEKIINSLGGFLQDMINNVISMIILAIWLSFLPDILTYLSEIQGIETYSWLEQSLLSKYFFYQIFNVFFVFTIYNMVIDIYAYFNSALFISVWEYLNKKPIDILTLIATSLTNVAPFFLNYTMLQTFLILSVQLIYPGPFIKSILVKIFRFFKTPRNYSNLSDPKVFSLNYGYVSTIPLVMYTIVVTYSCISPIIIIFGVLYYAYSLLIYKYQLLYIHYPRYESYGSFVPLYIKRCLFGIGIFQFTMIGILFIKNSINNTEDETSIDFYGLKFFIILLPLIFVTLIIHWWFKQSFEKHFKYLPLEVIAKNLNYGNSIVNSKLTTSDSLDNVSCSNYCSYCGTHDIMKERPINYHDNNYYSNTTSATTASTTNDSIKYKTENGSIPIRKRNIIHQNEYSNDEKSPVQKHGNKINNIQIKKNDKTTSTTSTSTEPPNLKININYKTFQNMQSMNSDNSYKPRTKKKPSQSDISNSNFIQDKIILTRSDESYTNISTVVNNDSPLSCYANTPTGKELYTQSLIPATPSPEASIISITNERNSSNINTPTLSLDNEEDDENYPNKRNIQISSNANYNITHSKSKKINKKSTRYWIFDNRTDYQQPRSVRVNGILDIPFDVYQKNGGYLDVGDNQLLSYEHPALIGNLPSLWLSDKLNTGVEKGEELLNLLTKEYDRIHENDLSNKNYDDDDNIKIEEDIECDNDYPEWIKKIKKKKYKGKKKIEHIYNSSVSRYIDSIVQWINLGLR